MKYNYDSWLNDSAFLFGEPATRALNGLQYLVQFQHLSIADWQRILTAQSEGFDKAVEMTLKSEIKMFNQKLKKTKNPIDLYKFSIDINEEIFAKEKNEVLNVLAGTRNINITGSQYKKIMSDYSRFEAGKLNVSYKYNRNMLLTAIYNFNEWLKSNRELITKDKTGGKKLKAEQEYILFTVLPESVPELFDRLVEKKLIKGSKEHFIWAFGFGENKPPDFKLIEWLRSNTLLAYLIERVCHNQRNKWKVAEKTFGVTGLAQSYCNIKKTPRGHELIDEIMGDIM